MIPNQWYAVLESKQVKKGKVIGVTRLGEKLAFWRNQDGTVNCIVDKCIHRGVQLSKGKILNNHHLECPFHGFQYDETGAVKIIPARGRNASVEDYFKQKAYVAKDKGGLIFIYWGEWPQDLSELPPIPMFEELLDKRFSYSTKYDHWSVHYSLVIENQLDVVHLPFVHASTIGRGYRTLVNGPGLQKCEDEGITELQVQPYNVKDDGKTIPLKQSEIPKDLKTYLYFRFPNIWINRISSSTIIFIAFAPIDDENTLLYLRFYTKSSIPLISTIIRRIGARGNLVIAGQDKRVVTTQQPKKSSLKMEGQKLISGDRPIIEYRRGRQNLIEKSKINE